ncbi:hypothetical protein BD779DRAFT_1561333, partial [Infundibulicybe gibba]
MTNRPPHATIFLGLGSGHWFLGELGAGTADLYSPVSGLKIGVHSPSKVWEFRLQYSSRGDSRELVLDEACGNDHQNWSSSIETYRGAGGWTKTGSIWLIGFRSLWPELRGCVGDNTTTSGREPSSKSDSLCCAPAPKNRAALLMAMIPFSFEASCQYWNLDIKIQRGPP